MSSANASTADLSMALIGHTALIDERHFPPDAAYRIFVFRVWVAEKLTNCVEIERPIEQVDPRRIMMRLTTM